MSVRGYTIKILFPHAVGLFGRFGDIFFFFQMLTLKNRYLTLFAKNGKEQKVLLHGIPESQGVLKRLTMPQISYLPEKLAKYVDLDDRKDDEEVVAQCFSFKPGAPLVP